MSHKPSINNIFNPVHNIDNLVTQIILITERTPLKIIKRSHILKCCIVIMYLVLVALLLYQFIVWEFYRLKFHYKVKNKTQTNEII